MDSQKNTTYIILLSCKDKKGLVFKITNFIYKVDGNIIDLQEHVDSINKMFFVRLVFDISNHEYTKEKIETDFSSLADEFDADWSLFISGKKLRTAVFVSKFDHCLQDILWRNSIEEFNLDIKLIISNHEDLKPLADVYGLPFHFIQVNKENKISAEKEEMKLLDEHHIDTIVLARYMQILSPDFVQSFQNRIINIHHSFLPAFIGGNPYRQAFERGVKIIGATSHYVTEDLDEGPIIEQDIIRISHSDSLKDLIRKGRDLERMVLARALILHSQHKILIFGKKTIVFN